MGKKRPKAQRVRRSFAINTRMTASADGGQVVEELEGSGVAGELERSPVHAAADPVPWDPAHVPAPAPASLLEQLMDYQARGYVRAELQRGADEAGVVLELDDDPETYEHDIGYLRYELDQLCRNTGLAHLADRELSRYATRERTGMDLEYAEFQDQITFAIARARDRQSS